MRSLHLSLVTGSALGLLAILGCGGASTSTGATLTGSAPTAAFTLSTATPTVSQSVSFSDATTGDPTSWLWTFGDGGTSTLQQPTHTYLVAGSFDVTLKATNTFGSHSTSHIVIVSPAPTAPTPAFTFAPIAPTTGQQVIFTDTSTGNPTTWWWTFGDGSTSPLQNPSHPYSTVGTFTVSLLAGNAAGSPTASQTVTVAAGGAGPSGVMNLAQTLSDGAQRTTLAFDGLALMTGNLEAQSFFPPGKVADYTGFQYLRDNDPSDMGHNTSFLTRVANNVIYTLTEAQLAKLVALATAHQAQIDLYGYKRFPLMKAFRRLLDGEVPLGSSGLNLNAVKKASRELYLIDGQISFDRALLYADVLNSLDVTQNAYLAAMKGKGWTSWPDITDDQIKSKISSLPRGSAVAVTTYASDLYSWYAGSIEADVYFCPERQGTYYGGFYIKDAPAIGHEGYGINEQLTATAGAALCDSSKGYVTQDQAAVISSLIDLQRNNLYASTASSIVLMRTQIATLLRGLLISTASSDSVRSQVLALSGTYGDLDGENNYHYATVFAQVYKTLSANQKTKLADLRNSIMSGTYADGTHFDFSVCTTPFLYSAVISDLGLLAPYTANTDYLFFEP